MAYKYEDKINEAFFTASRDGRNVNGELLAELQEVYNKAKILNKIIDIVKTGRSLEDFGDVEVTLLAIEHELNYMLEDK